MPLLTHLSLAYNELHLGFPQFVFNCHNLTYLDLSMNGLSGSIPESLYTSLTKLQFLNLTSNSFEGQLSSNISKLSKLKGLQEGMNQFNGSILESIGTISDLEILELHLNFVEGKIPSSLGQLKKLMKLDLQTNGLNSSIPSQLGSCTNLTHLVLNDNRLSGELPISLSQLTKITDLDLFDNSFVGGISPSLISNWTNLISLQLQDNSFTGQIPPEIGLLTNLNFLFLYNNNLSGSIPSEVGNLNYMTSLDLSRNKLTGEIPKVLDKCKNFFRLNLSHNNLSGEIPPQLGSLSDLLYFDVNSNSLSGTIPPERGKLVTLLILNVSHNYLSGTVPPQLSSMIGLSLFDFSYNELTGPVPSDGLFQNASKHAFVGNSGFCGNAEGLTRCTLNPTNSNFNNKKVAPIAIIVPICPIIIFLMTLSSGLAIITRRRAKAHSNNIPLTTKNGDLFSIWNFDGHIAYEDIITATEDFDIKYCIGTGGYGSVYKADLPSGKVVALKKLHTAEAEDPTFNRSFMNEVKLLTEIRQRNIVKLHGFCLHNRCNFLVYQYMERGSLFCILRNDVEAVELDWSLRFKAIESIAHALCYLHHDCSPPIVHQDISTNNVLFNSELEAFVSDFGIARLLDPDSSNPALMAT